MVEEGDLDDKLEDKATNEVVDDVKKVAMEGVDKEKKQVAMKVANTNCLDDLIDDALLLLFLLLDWKMLQLSNMWTIVEQIVLVFIFFLFHVNIICGQKQLRTITLRVQTVQVCTNQFSKCRLDSCH